LVNVTFLIENQMRPKSLLFPLLLVFYEIVTYLSNDMYLPALPQIATDFGVTHAEAQFSLTAWFLGTTSMQLIYGPLSDRYGRRPILLFGGVLFILSSAICASMPNMNSFLFARFVQGTTVCSMIIAGYASIHELYDQKHAVRILALMSSITVLAPTLGPLGGSIVLYFLNWQWIFWILVIWGAIAILLLFKWMPETNPPEKRHPLALQQLAKNYVAVLTNFRFMTTMIAFCCVFCGFIFWLSSGPFIVADEFHLNTTVFGLCQSVIFGCYLIANYWVKHLLDRMPIEKLIRNGLFIALSGALLGVILATLFPNFLYGTAIGMMIYSLGAGFAFAPLNRSAIEASHEPMGIRMAIHSTLMSAFGIIGTLSASFFYQGTLSSFNLTLLALITVACVIYALSRKFFQHH
jgi:Bcr/CflA subfamily drug resistance transporter